MQTNNITSKNLHTMITLRLLGFKHTKEKKTKHVEDIYGMRTRRKNLMFEENLLTTETRNFFPFSTCVID